MYLFFSNVINFGTNLSPITTRYYNLDKCVYEGGIFYIFYHIGVLKRTKSIDN